VEQALATRGASFQRSFRDRDTERARKISKFMALWYFAVHNFLLINQLRWCDSRQRNICGAFAFVPFLSDSL
jgi:hypothetical protein